MGLITEINKAIELNARAFVDDVLANPGPLTPEVMLSKAPEVSRVYHDLTKAPGDQLRISNYLVGKRKERSGKCIILKTLEIDVVVSLGRVQPKDTDKIDKLLDFTESLDEHLESIQKVGVANTVINEEQTDFWLPDYMHANALFLAVIPLQFQWKKSFKAQ